MPSSEPPRTRMEQAALYLACASAVAVLFSIAASQILLALALAALLLSGTRLRFPPVALPLLLFIGGTILSLAFSAAPREGAPQVRKFIVFLVLVAVFSAVREMRHVRVLVLFWAGAGAVVGLRSLAQFAGKMQEARRLGVGFYDYYVGERTTGFMSHWMTFGGQEMIVLLLTASFVIFAPGGRGKAFWFRVGCALILAVALVLGFTRSIWLATAAAGIYLLWFWRRWLIAVVPVFLAAGIWIAPGSVRERAESLVRPKGEIDSNQHRIVCWRTGWNMIRAHPWLGLGPEHVRIRFDEYVPADVARPLPRGWYGHLHNVYLHYAAERGIPAMLMLVWMLVKMFADFLRAARKLPRGPSEEKAVLHGAAAVVLAVMISGIFELNLGDSEVLTVFLAVAACGYVAVENARRAQQAA